MELVSKMAQAENKEFEDHYTGTYLHDKGKIHVMEANTEGEFLVIQDVEDGPTSMIQVEAHSVIMPIDLVNRRDHESREEESAEAIAHDLFQGW